MKFKNKIKLKKKKKNEDATHIKRLWKSLLFTCLYPWGEQGDFREQPKETGLAFTVIGK